MAGSRTDPQLSFDGLLGLDELQSGTAEIPLRDTTFVVVDTETTGGRSRSPRRLLRRHHRDRCGEGARRRGHREFATLVDPGRAIPPQIVELTGITTAMVRDAPAIEAVLPMFLEFARGAVLAHNAGFDVGFLRAAAQRCGMPWPRPPVLCTVRLAGGAQSRRGPQRAAVRPGPAGGAATQPTHRALDDARATVDVLHALIARVGNQGIATYGDLRSYLPGVSNAQRGKGFCTTASTPTGVYLFRGPGDEVLYIGTTGICAGASPSTSPGPIPAAGPRTPSARRPRAAVQQAVAVSAPVVVDRADRRTVPRLSVVREPRVERAVGPFRSRADAVDTAGLIARFTGRANLHGPDRYARCPRPELPAREVSPCPAASGLTAADYTPAPQRAAALIDGWTTPLWRRRSGRWANWPGGRVMKAPRGWGSHRLSRGGAVAGQRLRALAAVAELVAAALTVGAAGS